MESFSSLNICFSSVFIFSCSTFLVVFSQQSVNRENSSSFVCWIESCICSQVSSKEGSCYIVMSLHTRLLLIWFKFECFLFLNLLETPVKNRFSHAFRFTSRRFQTISLNSTMLSFFITSDRELNANVTIILYLRLRLAFLLLRWQSSVWCYISHQHRHWDISVMSLLRPFWAFSEAFTVIMTLKNIHLGNKNLRREVEVAIRTR